MSRDRHEAALYRCPNPRQARRLAGSRARWALEAMCEEMNRCVAEGARVKLPRTRMTPRQIADRNARVSEGLRRYHAARRAAMTPAS